MKKEIITQEDIKEGKRARECKSPTGSRGCYCFGGKIAGLGGKKKRYVP